MPRWHRSSCWSNSTARHATGKRRAATENDGVAGVGATALRCIWCMVAPARGGIGHATWRRSGLTTPQHRAGPSRVGLNPGKCAGPDQSRMVAVLVGQGLGAGHRRGGADPCGGFLFGGVIAGLVAANAADRVRSLTLIGNWRAGPTAEPFGRAGRVRDRTGADRVAAHRENLLRMMLANPAGVDALALEIQEQNTKRARLNSGFMWMSLQRHDALPLVQATSTRSGASTKMPDRAMLNVRIGLLRQVRARTPRSRSFRTPATGFYEAAERLNVALLRILARQAAQRPAPRWRGPARSRQSSPKCDPSAARAFLGLTPPPRRHANTGATSCRADPRGAYEGFQVAPDGEWHTAHSRSGGPHPPGPSLPREKPGLTGTHIGWRHQPVRRPCGAPGRHCKSRVRRRRCRPGGSLRSPRSRARQRLTAPCTRADVPHHAPQCGFVLRHGQQRGRPCAFLTPKA